MQWFQKLEADLWGILVTCGWKQNSYNLSPFPSSTVLCVGFIIWQDLPEGSKVASSGLSVPCTHLATP